VRVLAGTTLLAVLLAGAPVPVAAGEASPPSAPDVAGDPGSTDASQLVGTEQTDAEMVKLEGLPIVRIIFIRRDIFDTSRPETSSWPYRWANALHIVSKEDFIRQMLLFEEGDPFLVHEAEESARILRGLGFINPVVITAREVEGGVEVTVDTHDQWTLEVGAKFGLFGNRSDYGFSFDEENLLGRGWLLGIKYRDDDERHSWTYALYDPNILGSRWRARVEHQEASDGDASLARVDYPFYSLATRRAGGFEWFERSRREHLYSLSETVVTGDKISDSWRLWGGIRLPGERATTRRLITGYEYLKEEYRDWVWEDEADAYLPPETLEVSGVHLGYEQVADRFVVLHGFRSWRAQEDVALGPTLRAGVTVSLPSLGGDRHRYLFDADAARVWPLGDWLLLGRAWTSGRFDGSELRDAVLGFELVASQLKDSAWQARLRVDTSHELDRDRQLTLGADLGLRGWDPDYFDGTSRAVANLQWRTKLADDVLHLFTLGMVVFADAGYTWGARVGPGTDRVHADVGIGLVADVTEVGLVKLLRVEVALPDDGSGYAFTVTTSHLF
jgi:hypothetical protein